MSTQAIIWLVLLAINLLSNAYMHGKPKTGNYNFWAYLFNVGLYFWLLYAGGFFTIR